MPCSHSIILALLHFTEAGDAAELAEGGHAGATAGADFVGVALVGDVPDYFIFGGLGGI